MPRPVFFNLVQIQMPVGALTSITHRATGIVLAVGIPYTIYLLDLSLQSPQSFAQLTGLFHQWLFKIAAVVFIWALAHHLLAGTRANLRKVANRPRPCENSKTSCFRGSVWYSRRVDR